MKQRTEVLSAVVNGSAAQLRQLNAGLNDLLAAGNVRELHLAEAEGELSVFEVELAPVEAV